MILRLAVDLSGMLLNADLVRLLLYIIQPLGACNVHLYLPFFGVSEVKNFPGVSGLIDLLQQGCCDSGDQGDTGTFKDLGERSGNLKSGLGDLGERSGNLKSGLGYSFSGTISDGEAIGPGEVAANVDDDSGSFLICKIISDVCKSLNIM